MVVEEFGDADETYSDLQDELVALVVEVLVLQDERVALAGGVEGVRWGWGADSNAMLCCLDSNAICTCFLLKFVSPILASGSKKPQRRLHQQNKRQR